MYREIVSQQIALLTKVNEQLAGQGAPGASMEIRKNIRLIVNLAELEGLRGIESRVRQMEDCILGDSKNKGFVRYVEEINRDIGDCEERLMALENRVGDEDTWEMLEEEELPDYPHEETLIGILERVKILEATRYI